MAYQKVEGSGKWDWDKIKEFEGTLVGSETKRGRNDKEYEQYTLREATTGEEFKFSGIVLEGKLAKLTDGDKVKITFLGKKQTQNGSFNDFEVEVWQD